MLQSIKLLALPLADLTQEIQTELENNPALEVVEDSSTLSLDSYSEDRKDSEPDEWVNENSGELDYSSRAPSGDDDSKRKFMEGAIAFPETLQSHLLAQVGLIQFEDDDRNLAEKLIQNLDDNGFHIVPPRELCPECTEDRLESIISIIQRFDPSGTCTSGYKESLIVQARNDQACPEGAIEILENHLGELEAGKFTDIRKSLQINDARLKTIIEYVKSLSPFPGREFAPDETRYVIPDLAIRIENGEFIIELNNDTIPVLGINPFISQLSEKKSGNRETVRFARENVERARFFMHSLAQRNATLLKVAKAIIRFQTRFFTQGPKGMQPLTLREVADEIGVHETTVSRVVNGKYVQTDWGFFELRRFFTNSVSGSGSMGSSHSKESVKEVIRELLESRKAEGVKLADREVMEILAQRGITIARRTVAKYRGELETNPSVRRKKAR
jgi:RNA polymerase sigma-54 factor